MVRILKTWDDIVNFFLTLDNMLNFFLTSKVFLVRMDLKMNKGKIAAQCGHAAVAGYRVGFAIHIPFNGIVGTEI